MKKQYFHLIWYSLLNSAEKKSSLYYQFIDDSYLKSKISSLDFTKNENVLDYLYYLIPRTIVNISHRRKNFFSFNPKTKEDFLYLSYIENARDFAELTYLQRLLLSRLIFKINGRTVTCDGIDFMHIVNPITIEVNNV